MTSDPLVSVIIPAYNAKKYITEALDSITSQTYTNLEVIVLDDASSDETYKVACELANKDSRVTVIKNPKNLFIAGNRNKGISLAKGKYIVWQDADDISEASRVEKLVMLMESDSTLGIAGSNLQVFDEDGFKEIRSYATGDYDLRKNIFKFSPVAQPSAIVRKDCFDSLGVYDINTPPVEDLDMSFRIGTKYKFANISEPLLRYRLSPTNQTNSNLKKMIRITLDTRKKYSKDYGYKMRASDHVAYFITWLTLYIPQKVTYPLFNFARNILTALHI